MTVKGLGIPYTGNKSAIAERICKCFPRAENFYDLFAGGFSITCFMLANYHYKYKNFHANDIKSDVIQLFKEALTGKYSEKSFKPDWISRKEFDRLRENDPYIRYVWSFGNNGKNYLYSGKIEEYKKSLHNAIVFNQFDDLAIKTLKMDKWPDKIDSIYKKRLYLRKKIEYYRVNNLIPEVLYKYLPEKELKTIKKNKAKKINCNNKSKRLQPLQQIEQLERLERLEQLERLQHLQQLQQLIQWESLGRIQCLKQLQPLERIGQLQQLESLGLPQKLTLTNLSYEQVEVKPNSIVYCDPPYRGTFDYHLSFDREKFLNWADSLQEIVFISEYNIDDKRFALFTDFRKRCTFKVKETVVREKLYINRYGKQRLMS